jgi:hypothetical protein
MPHISYQSKVIQNEFLALRIPMMHHSEVKHKIFELYERCTMHYFGYFWQQYKIHKFLQTTWLKKLLKRVVRKGLRNAKSACLTALLLLGLMSIKHL